MKQDIDEVAKRLQQQILDEALKQFSKVVIGHWMNPRNFFAMNNPDGHAKVKGPCGDIMEIFIRIREGKIVDASFLTNGCMTSIASGSMVVEMSIGRSIGEAWAISQDDILNELDSLPEEYTHCALLASNTLREAVMNYLRT